MTIIGIPHYNDFEGLIQVVNSIIDSTNAEYKIVIINSDKEIEWKIDAEIINTPKLGPLDAYNRLFKIAKERKEDLFLTQTDVYFPYVPNRDWLKEMQKIAKNPKCGTITCWGGGGVSGKDFIDGYPWIGAWCTYIPYRVIEKLGGYDISIPLGWGVDIDYTYAVERLGLRNCQINYWVDHHPNYKEGHEHEHRDDIEQLKKEAFRYMREKWKVEEYK